MLAYQRAFCLSTKVISTTSDRRRDCSPSFLSAVVGVYMDSVAKRTNSNHYADTHRPPYPRRAPPPRPHQRLADGAHRCLRAHFATIVQPPFYRHPTTVSYQHSSLNRLLSTLLFHSSFPAKY